MAGEYGGMIGAYTHIGNIKKQTIPEYSLANELKKGNLTKSKLKQFIYNFDFKDYEEYDQLNFTQFYIYESIVEDMSPRDRITLLFDKKENLAGIIHSRKLTTDRFKTYKLIRGHSLTITSDMKESEVEELINKRIKFYNSVD
jgi:hypothetical protein